MRRGHILRKMGGSSLRLVNGGVPQGSSEAVDVDDKGAFVGTRVGSSLLAALLVKGGQVKPAIKPANKRARGRPRKVVAAEIWNDVTAGAGVVLQDGEPVLLHPPGVEVPKALM